MKNTGKFTLLNGSGPGSTPDAPLALVVKLSESELESRCRNEVADISDDGSNSRRVRYCTSIHASL
jgi:hypothetical protein